MRCSCTAAWPCDHPDECLSAINVKVFGVEGRPICIQCLVMLLYKTPLRTDLNLDESIALQKALAWLHVYDSEGNVQKLVGSG